ncbi:(2Fe-2S)-binding protein [Pseudofulvimonas gallinarii]|jgi:bacterioferritin-associated ferredoxin|uniref:Bacterioferritin-associated ferredoxin n=1 Tax=Pseudofulvimonas gallinarii TaxID=634155 RepID=A0A4S3KX81_9GAMM|nr:(2Fe-2S)-binding protein [Pseudofulvimonas gallinarii]TCS98178.1 bacterioferritin-associated ferredoxin [Pseudofulvimonas gallinarii]THD13840.1 (2Fe-2S)-binding protein [Pseudofulvimonas gallinarii]
MYVCICNAVTDRAVREAAAQGVSCVGELTMRTGCGGGCGACVELAEQILQESASPSANGRMGVAIAA